MSAPRLVSNDTFEVVRFRQRTRAEREAAWLAERGKGVGGSDMSTILGLNKYKTPYVLWLEKTGRAEHEDIGDRWPVIKGNVLENELRKRFRLNHPEFHVTTGTDISLISRAHPVLHASLDGVIWDEEHGFGVLECKTASAYRAADWHDDDGNLRAPDYYMAQVTHYLAVTGWQWGYFIADIGESEPVEVRFERDEQDVQTVIDAAETFWKFVTDDIAPELTGGDIDTLYPADDGELKTVNSEKFDEWSSKYLDLSNRISNLKSQRSAVGQTLKVYIGEHRGLKSDHWKATYTTTHYKESIRKSYDARVLRVSKVKER